MAIFLSPSVFIEDNELDISAVRAQGPGGQNVNKVSSAIHLRFDIHASALPERIKQKLFNMKDKRITKEGIIIIKAQQFRTQDKNREDALSRLEDLVKKAMFVPKTRKPTKPSRSAVKKRLDTKKQRSQVKALRGKVSH